LNENVNKHRKDQGFNQIKIEVQKSLQFMPDTTDEWKKEMEGLSDLKSDCRKHLGSTLKEQRRCPSGLLVLRRQGRRISNTLDQATLRSRIFQRTTKMCIVLLRKFSKCVVLNWSEITSM